MATIPPESKKSMLPGHTVLLSYVPRIFHGNFPLFFLILHAILYPLFISVSVCRKNCNMICQSVLELPPPPILHSNFIPHSSPLPLPSFLSSPSLSFSLSSSSSPEPRPIPPPVFNEGEVRQQLVEYYRTNHRSPGEPILVPELHHNHAITQQCPR